MIKRRYRWLWTKYAVSLHPVDYVTDNQFYFIQSGMLSSPSAPERHAGCKVIIKHVSLRHATRHLCIHDESLGRAAACRVIRGRQSRH